MKKAFLVLTVFILTSQLLSSQTTIDSSLIAYFPFYGNAMDSSGNNNHGNVLGPLLTTDRFDNFNAAFLFDGIDDVIEIPAYTNMSPVDAVTIAAWIKTNSYIGAPAIYDRLQENDGYGLRLYGEGNIRLTINGGSQDVISSQIVSDGEWHHVAGTYDSFIGKLMVYVDGNYDSSSNYTSPITYSPEPRNVIGGIGGSNPTYFNGKIDELRIYSRALSLDEIKLLYSSDTLGITPDSAIERVKINLYPNPASKILSIDINNWNKDFCTINLFNMSGNSVFKNNYQITKPLQIYVGDLKVGTYIMQVKSDKVIFTEKVIIH